MPFNDIMEKIARKVVPGKMKKIEDKTKADLASSDASDAMQKYRKMKMMLRPKTNDPAEHNRNTQKFNANPKVKKLQDMVGNYKIKKSIGM